MVNKRDEFIEGFLEDKERLIIGSLKCMFYMLTGYDREWVVPFAEKLLDKMESLADSNSSLHKFGSNQR